ncbi:MAG TPA: CBS domain-containing protein, partial [Firmicutes bacterium]|nr:CBS domain-containing protein [Bacillota bacterium]
SILLEEIRKQGIALEETHIRLFLLGLYEDTGFFSYISLHEADVRTFADLFGQLKEKDISYLSRYLVTDLTAEQLSIMDDLAKQSSYLDTGNGKIAFCTAEREEYVSNISFVAQRLLVILAVEAVFVLVRLGKTVYFLARSRNRLIDVRESVAPLGGGGHPSAAYVALKEISYVDAREKVYDIIIQSYKKERPLREIMNPDVVSSTEEETIAQVREKMLAYNHSKIPVTDGRGSILGMITQKEVNRLYQHGFGHFMVSDYMDREVPVLAENEDILKAREEILEKRKSMVLVSRDGALAGIITKNDLLLMDFLGEGQKRNIRNLSSDIKYSLKGANYKRVHAAGEIADSLGYRAYVVGGFVRDLLLKRTTYDIDLVVEGSGVEVARALGEKEQGKVIVHRKFQTATVLFADGFKMDIATARSETYSRPGALPVVMRSPLKYDLYRRDFTMNAMAISLSGESFGDLYDFFGGYDDLKKGVLKVLHTISFIEDPSRILRGVRFASRFDFSFGKQTLGLLKNALEMKALRYLSGRRVKDELFLIFDEDYPENAFSLMEELGIFSALFPGFHFTKEKVKIFREIRHTIHWYRLLYFKKKIHERFLYLMALFSDMGQDMRRECTEKLELTKRFQIFTDQVESFVRERYKTIHVKRFLKKSEIYDLFRHLELDVILYLMAAYAHNERFQQYASLYIMEISRKRQLVNGNDLKDKGFKRGEELRKVLETIHKMHIDGEIKTREEALRYLKRLATS